MSFDNSCTVSIDVMSISTGAASAVPNRIRAPLVPPTYLAPAAVTIFTRNAERSPIAFATRV